MEIVIQNRKAIYLIIGALEFFIHQDHHKIFPQKIMGKTIEKAKKPKEIMPIRKKGFFVMLFKKLASSYNKRQSNYTCITF